MIKKTPLTSVALQMSKVTREKCAEIVQTFEPSAEAKLLGHLGIDGERRATFAPNEIDSRSFLGFTNYLLSSECDIFNPSHRSVCHDMTQPLNHYFIASSYNTYARKASRVG